MEINFECQQCGIIFDCEVGTVQVEETTYTPQFGNEIHCPTCGRRTIDQLLLTELGQSQLTEATLDFDPGELFSPDDDGLFGMQSSGECQGCDAIHPLNDLGLCGTCADKLDRDLIRERDWAYSVLAFGVPAAQREELRHRIIAQYGEKLELIAPSKHPASTRKQQTKRKKKRVKGVAKR